MPLLPSPEPTVSYFDDLDHFKDFEKEFPAIVYNDSQTSKLDFLTEPTLSPQHIDEFDLKDEASLSECDEEEQKVLYFNDLFSFNVIYPDDSKMDKYNDDDKIDIENSSGDLSVKSLPDVINTDVGAYAHGLNKLLETSINTAYLGEWIQRIDFLYSFRSSQRSSKIKYQKDHLCSACALGKSKKHSHKPKAKDSIQEKLYLLHMDLCGPMRIQKFVIKFLKMIQVRLNATVRNIKTDNGTEFVNQTLKAYYEEVGISHQPSVACTPQQNDVVERWNRTLVEVARTIALCYPTNDGEDLGPGPKLLTPGTISSGLVQNIPSSTPYVLPTKNDWEILFQPMFDEYLNPPPCVDPHVPTVIAPEPVVSTGTPSSTTIYQDAPYTSTSQTNQETPSPVIPLGVEEDDHDIEVARIDNNPYVDFPIPEPSSEESFTQIYQSPRGIYLNQSKYTLESLKKYGMETCDLVDTPMVEKSKLDEDTQGKAIDPTRYYGMMNTLMYLTSSRPDLVFVVCMYVRYQAKPTEKNLHAVK
ncbi:retrovirus-related pol polyprotein from transposon TNT 1-94 [Tanacetum coccineum]